MDYIKIILPFKRRTEVLALGAQSKASFCFVRNGVAYLSRPDGDLADLKNFEFFEKGIKELGRRLKARPRIIACDLHPEYISTKLANDMRENGVRLRQIQHHEAHVASSIVDNNVKGDVIGVAFDGTGFGADGNIWGGEFFVGSIKGFKRVAHLKYIPMPGGESSIREPWRMTVSYLYNIYGARFSNLKIDFLKRLDRGKVNLILQIINKRINSPLTSSVGRLFDGVSSILDICNVADYEGQGAVELEKVILAPGSSLQAEGAYDFSYIDKGGATIIDWASLVKGILKDLQFGKEKKEISLKFHNAICVMVKDVCVLSRKKYKIDKVCLTGGVFQNRYLTSRIKPLLEKDKFEVYLHKNMPAHDGNIALGQAVLAGA